ncbi:hypothetical protein LCGC14_2440500 [marine sediment metagenome]|uniref:Putative zinc-ribbon domain-containing protein n=1 Tax=marine sediment metagenome TaxID=412755 RepID=A0A0F9ED36_9ZZZZ
MPLRTCPDCGDEVSDRADACPNCGYPFAKDWGDERWAAARQKRRQRNIIVFAIAAAIVAFLIVNGYFWNVLDFVAD